MIIYASKLKNREFDKEATQIFCLERVTIAERQGTSENQKSEAQPTQSKTDSSICWCINLFNRLFEFRELAKNAQFLRLMAITVRHAHFDAKRDPELGHLLQFITSSLGDFMENQMTLLEAADSFSEQDPRYSDLSELLSEIAVFGPLFIQLPLAAADQAAPDLAMS